MEGPTLRSFNVIPPAKGGESNRPDKVNESTRDNAVSFYALKSLREAVDSLNTMNTTALVSQSPSLAYSALQPSSFDASSNRPASQKDIISDAEVKAFVRGEMTADDLGMRQSSSRKSEASVSSDTENLSSEVVQFSPKHAANSTPNLTTVGTENCCCDSGRTRAKSSCGAEFESRPADHCEESQGAEMAQCQTKGMRTRSEEPCASFTTPSLSGFQSCERSSPGMAKKLVDSEMIDHKTIKAEHSDQSIENEDTSELDNRNCPKSENGDAYVGMRLAHSLACSSSVESDNSEPAFPGICPLSLNSSHFKSQRPYLSAPKMANFNEEDPILTEISLESALTFQAVPTIDADVTHMSPIQSRRVPRLEKPFADHSDLTPSPETANYECPFTMDDFSKGEAHVTISSGRISFPSGPVMPSVADGLSSGSDLDSPSASPSKGRHGRTSGQRRVGSKGNDSHLYNPQLVRSITDDIRDIKRAVNANQDLPPVIPQCQQVAESHTLPSGSKRLQERSVHDLREFSRPCDESTITRLAPASSTSTTSRDGPDASTQQHSDDAVWIKRGDSPPAENHVNSSKQAPTDTSQAAPRSRQATSGHASNGKNKDGGYGQRSRRGLVGSKSSGKTTKDGRHQLEAQHWTFPPSNRTVYSTSSESGDSESSSNDDEDDSEDDDDEEEEDDDRDRSSDDEDPPQHLRENPVASEEEVRHNSLSGRPSTSTQRHIRRSSLPNAGSVSKTQGIHRTTSNPMEEAGACCRDRKSVRSLGKHNTASPAQRQEGDYESDEDTDRLLKKEYQEDQAVDIPELKEEKIQSEKKKRGREVAVRHPDHPTVLIEGVLFRANYLGSTQLVSEGQPSKATRMMQAQEAVGRIKAPEGETQPSVAVDLFVSTEKIMVLNTNLQEIMMDHALRTISYIADIGDVLVLMARRRFLPSSGSPTGEDGPSQRRQMKIVCHVFESEEAQLIAQSIGHAFQVAYMEFLRANGIDDPSLFKEMDYQEVLNQQEIYAEELHLFADKEMQKEVIVPKQRGEPLGVVIVESGWGSMLPTVVLANMSPTGPAARCGQLNIGNQIIAVNGHSLVGLPLSTCQQQIKTCRNQTSVKLTMVSCPPVVEVLIKRPDVKYQLGFSVQNGVICSLLRGGIAERGGIRVGHRIIEINGQSVVAIPHEKIVNILATAVGEIHIRTMPTSIFRLLTGQETPHYI